MRAGLPVAVSDATHETKKSALFVTQAPGGYGAVREMCEIILKAKGVWPEIDGIDRKNKLGFT